MWIVRLALRRTYTFIVMALLIAVLGAVSIYRMSTDMFPNIVIPIYFQPGANVAEAETQVTATCQTLLKVLPPGITPPYIVRYSATSVPIVQIAVSSDTLTEQQILDYCQNFIIQQLGTVQGARVPQPWGGKQRQLMVDLDLDALYARGLSPNDVSTAITNQNLIIPAGVAKMGATEYNIKLNSSPEIIDAFN